ncbi:MAG TPA: glycosyltransferase family 2 protein, partial [Nitrospirota bacterium]
MPRLSVVIITFNEEANVRDALESAKWADEIVVVDSFSEDRTPEISREYTENFHQEKWRGFSGQKSLAVSLAKNDWVFVLDSDERITDGLRAEISGLMEKGLDKAGYYCARRNHFMGMEIRHGGWYPDYSMRMFDRTKGGFIERKVHEAVEVRGETGYLKNPMLHFTYTGISDYLTRMDRYSALAADELFGRGRHAGLTDLLFRPPFTFFKMYVLKQGFRDGMHGLVLAALYSFYTFSKYAKLWEFRLAGKTAPRADNLRGSRE